MEKVFQVLLSIHILGGGISLISGLYIMLAQKGTKIHKQVGDIYFWALLTSSITAFPMSYIHPNLFLFMVGIFTAYMLLTGKRYLKIKNIQSINTLDYILVTLMLIVGLIFLVYGSLLLIQKNTFGLVLLFFGLICSLYFFQDLRTFKGKTKFKNFSLVMHIQRMIASYIASTTAFLVVNNQILPSVVAWLLPSILIVPLILKWTKKHQVLKI